MTPKKLPLKSSLRMIALILGSFILSGYLPVLVRAQVVAETQAFDRGTQELKNGEYPQAIASFDEAESFGLGSAGLYYNRAVAHYRLNQVGEAIRYFHRAELLDPDDIRIQHSLSIASSDLVDQFSELPAPIWKRFQRALDLYMSSNAMIATGVALYILLSLLIIIRIRRIYVSSWQRRISSFVAVFSFLFLAMGFSSAVWPADLDHAVVLIPEISVREQPDEQADESIRIHEGLVVATLSRVGEWVLIQLPNGAQGWTTENGLGAI